MNPDSNPTQVTNAHVLVYVGLGLLGAMATALAAGIANGTITLPKEIVPFLPVLVAGLFYLTTTLPKVTDGPTKLGVKSDAAAVGTDPTPSPTDLAAAVVTALQPALARLVPPAYNFPASILPQPATAPVTDQVTTSGGVGVKTETVIIPASPGNLVLAPSPTVTAGETPPKPA